MEPKTKKLNEIELPDIVAAGLKLDDAKTFYTSLGAVVAGDGSAPDKTWRRVVSSRLLRPDHPHCLHQLVYHSVYAGWDASMKGPPPYWFPTLEEAKKSNLGKLMEAHCPKLLGPLYQDPITSFPLFHKFSTEHPEDYWKLVIDKLAVKFHKQPVTVWDDEDKAKHGGTWFRGAVLNVAEGCLLPKSSIGKEDDAVAVIWRQEGEDDLPVNKVTLRDLRSQVMLVANALDATFDKGDAIAIDMPMTYTAVVIYLAIVLAGFVVVSIADSYAPKEIATRLKVARAKGIFTQDFIVRGGSKFELYSRVIEAFDCTAIVIPAVGDELGVQLRETIDMSWKNFLGTVQHLARPHHYSPVYLPIDSVTNILFSSGTTGEPKAIPWTQSSPIRCVSDIWAHLDVRPEDVFCWPTNLGWMLGSVLLYSCFLTGTTLALYHGSPLGSGFCEFVQVAGVTKLGTVPSLTKVWKSNCCAEGLDWTGIKTFATTGEASNADDILWLSSKADYSPIIEICGGTELSSAYLIGSLLQEQAFGAFSCPTMSTSFVILDDNRVPYPDDQPCTGEIGLFPVNMGSSDRLLNADHEEVYFKGMPTHRRRKLRRHGDVIQRTPRGYYVVHGRADDTMNLGGIKTSSVEIERVCNGGDKKVLETAAVSVKPLGGGPELLIILAVLKKEFNCEANQLKMVFSKAIQKNLNPLFKVSYVKVVPEFPRTPSNKLLRRVLRDQVMQELWPQSRL